MSVTIQTHAQSIHHVLIQLDPFCVTVIQAIIKLKISAKVCVLIVVLVMTTLYLFLDINECLNTTICPVHSVCLNTDGSYLCNCEVGYIKNDSQCIGK